MFWKKWHHRSPENFVEQLRILAQEYEVKIVWLADENFAANREIRTRQILRHWLATGLRVTVAEIIEFFSATHFSPLGTLTHLPGRQPQLTNTTVVPAGPISTK